MTKFPFKATINGRHEIIVWPDWIEREEGHATQDTTEGKGDANPWSPQALPLEGDEGVERHAP